jgi:hypothetical protein
VGGGRLSSSTSRSLPTAFSPIGAFLDIGQGAGLAGATGVRPFLPPLLAGALASGDVGIDFDGTDYRFLERPGFLAAVLALAAISYGAERLGANQILAGGLGLVALPIGALLFAGSLADGGHEGWPGLIAGVVCAALGYLVATRLLGRARGRLDAPAARLLPVWADLAALALAGASILAPPLGLVAIVALAYLLARDRGRDAEKYEGLRILR